MTETEQKDNLQAYFEAERRGDFKDLQPGTLIAFVNGIFNSSANDWDSLLATEAFKQRAGAAFIHQLGQEIPSKVIKRGARLANNQRR